MGFGFLRLLHLEAGPAQHPTGGDLGALVVEAPKQDRHLLHGLGVGLEVAELDLGRRHALVVSEDGAVGELADAGSIGLGRHREGHAKASPEATSTERLALLAVDRRAQRRAQSEVRAPWRLGRGRLLPPMGPRRPDDDPGLQGLPRGSRLRSDRTGPGLSLSKARNFRRLPFSAEPTSLITSSTKWPCSVAQATTRATWPPRSALWSKDHTRA